MGDKLIKLPEIDDRLCDGCEACVAACSPEALAIVGKKAIIVSQEGCDYCGDCETACPTGAIVCPFEIVELPE